MNRQSSFLDMPAPGTPPTESVKFAGSKLRLLPHILHLARTVDARTVLDGFSGTTRVSQALAKQGYTVLSNDIAIWSHVLATCYLLNRREAPDYQPLVDHLNAVQPVDGWFTEHYGGTASPRQSMQPEHGKKPWQIHNTRKLDGIREEIDRLGLTRTEHAVALTGLMLALDKVDNTLGHFASYLREWSPRSYNNLHLRVPDIMPMSSEHQVFKDDIFDLLPRVSADLAYFDPPYGSNNEKMPASRIRYSAYYHIWTSLCLFDRPAVFGKANRRVDSADRLSASVFEDFRKDHLGRFKAVSAVGEVIEQAQVRWLILSYSSGGRATASELNEIMRRNGRLLQVLEIDHRRNVMSEMTWTNAWVREASEPNREFLFLLEK